ncbi:MAG TPA: 3'(2'),5'-bisphosphate nucleotidase CysQ [Candidatus Binataceae bacterium]|nr:3'(2'),5'-bisphosphate nucleotidase CysQ [Candidatus Binataceae bacterium]
MNWELELSCARRAALEAGRIIRDYFGGEAFTVGSKGKQGPVTSADLEADAAVKSILGEAFPADAWLSEETADNSARLSCQRVWIVDPLDGTKEFIKRIPEFAVAIALAQEGVPVVGVTYNPIKDELFWAARGRGAFLGEQPIHVTPTTNLGRAKLLISRSEEARGRWKPFEHLALLKATGSVAYKLALVAAGRGDATFSRSPKSEWDVAAGHILLSEAGGLLTARDGSALRFNQPTVRVPGIIASNRLLHPQLVALANRPDLPAD